MSSAFDSSEGGLVIFIRVKRQLALHRFDIDDIKRLARHGPSNPIV